MDTEAHTTARLPFHDTLLARATELRGHQRSAAGHRAPWRLRGRAPVPR
ncbi:hypothetical protein [Nocardiopsis salina]|nr:hypothetical protein [Nocardiopsis salina]